jgi:hypothetical protein
MARRQTLQERLHERIAARRDQRKRLIAGFGRYVDKFDANRQFSGPSVYFHVKALSALRSHRSAVDALADDAFFDYLYATLASWGLHRMGPGYTKLAEIDDLKSSFIRKRDEIEVLQNLRIEDIGTREVDEVSDSIWRVLNELRVGVSETLLIANSKALHHVLPDLVPPIDRTYTLMFFLGRTKIDNGGDGDYFKALFPLFREIAVRRLEDICDRIRTPWQGMNTSVTKVVDNAILGFMAKKDGPNAGVAASDPMEDTQAELARAGLRATRARSVGKALSIRQPWAWAIVEGFKDVENRSWSTRYRGQLFIHAGRREDHLAWLDLDRRGIEFPDEVEHGGVIGVVDLVDCVEQHKSSWATEGSYHWLLTNPRSVPFVPMQGRLGIFNVEVAPSQ